MLHLNTILVGLHLDLESDALSQGSRAAAEQALWLAERIDARVEFLHSTHWNPEDEPRRGSEPRVALRAALAGLAPGRVDPESSLHLSDEPPWLALIRRVLAGRADLVVVAKRNAPVVEARRLGSEARRLIRKCPAPVWVVRPDHELHHRCILAATDNTAVGDRAVEYGAFLARAEGCTLHVVHAWQRSLELQLSMGRDPEEEIEKWEREIVRKASEHIRSVAGVAELGDQAKLTIVCDAPSRAVLHVNARVDPDLAVFGTISRGGLAGLLVGNTAERILERLDCSMLTVKPADFVCPIR